MPKNFCPTVTGFDHGSTVQSNDSRALFDEKHKARALKVQHNQKAARQRALQNLKAKRAAKQAGLYGTLEKGTTAKEEATKSELKDPRWAQIMEMQAKRKQRRNRSLSTETVEQSKKRKASEREADEAMSDTKSCGDIADKALPLLEPTDRPSRNPN